MLFYVFVAFVGINNNTILAMQNTEFGSSRRGQYRSDTDPEYRIDSPLIIVFKAELPPVFLLSTDEHVHGAPEN